MAAPCIARLVTIISDMVEFFLSILLFLGIGRQIAAIADSVTTTLEMLCYDIMNCLFYCILDMNLC